MRPYIFFLLIVPLTIPVFAVAVLQNYFQVLECMYIPYKSKKS